MKLFFPLEVFFPSQAGGPANSVYWLTKNLTEFGFESVIVATDRGLDQTVPTNIWKSNDFGKTIYVKTYISNLPLRQILIALQSFHKADIIHLSSVFFPTSFVTAFAAKFWRKKIILSPRGELDREVLKDSRIKKKPVLWLLKKFVGRYPLFHSTSPEETSNIKKIFGPEANVFEIPNYIELPEQVLRTPAKYILYIGRIHPKKAIDNLIRAIAVSKEFLDSDYTLRIAGTGQPRYVAYLKDLCEELNLGSRIRFIGQIEGPAKQKLYADAYFTVMPSHNENFGNVVLESMAQSTPVIASKGTPWKILAEEENGFWIDNSVESLSEQLSTIIKLDPDSYREYRTRSRDFVEREFDITTNIHKWVEVYRNLL